MASANVPRDHDYLVKLASTEYSRLAKGECDDKLQEELSLVVYIERWFRSLSETQLRGYNTEVVEDFGLLVGDNIEGDDDKHDAWNGLTLCEKRDKALELFNNYYDAKGLHNALDIFFGFVSNSKDAQEILFENDYGAAYLEAKRRVDDPVSDTDKSSTKTIELSDTIEPPPKSPRLVQTTLDVTPKRMPRVVGAYRHAVVYFNTPGRVGTTTKRGAERAALQQLVTDVSNWFTSYKATYKHGGLVVTHFYKNSNDASRGGRKPTIITAGGEVTIPSFPEPTYFIEPHVHVVYYSASNNDERGIAGCVRRWGRKQSVRFVNSTEEVRCYHGLRQYLCKGHGRVLCLEKVSATDDGERCDCGTADQESHGRDNFSCYNWRDTCCNRLGGKQ